MNRSNYFNYIEEHLTILSVRIANRGKINLLDLNIHSETFFADMLNIVFKINLENLNKIKQNIDAIDLVDEKNKIVAQVSATCSKQKLDASLENDIYKKYIGYTFKFISITKDAENLRNKKYNKPYGIVFNSENDIYDIPSILRIVINMPIDQQKNFYTFIKAELGNEIDSLKIDSNLTTIINILADEDLKNVNESIEINPFEITKKIIYNNLLPVQDLIDDYKIYYTKLNEKYTEFDKQGANKSLSVFNAIKNQYLKLLIQNKNESELFIAIVDSIINTIIQSKNYKAIPYEELEMCAYILVVDSFIRCKIFKNPEGYNHVIAR